MIKSEENARDLASLVVPCAGRLVSTGDDVEPYRLLDADGAVVEPVAVFLRELLAAGRSTTTLRSYGMDLLRWWQFLLTVDVVWVQATSLGASLLATVRGGHDDGVLESNIAREQPGETEMAVFLDGVVDGDQRCLGCLVPVGRRSPPWRSRSPATQAPTLAGSSE